MPSSLAHGWDHSPAVASPASLDDNSEDFGVWSPRECHWKTPQRLFSLDTSPKANLDERQNEDFFGGNLFCSPIVVSNKYILVASEMTIFLYGDFDSQDRYEESIQKRIDTTASPPLTKFSPLDTDFGDRIIGMTFHEETSIIYILTSESSVFQVHLMMDEPLHVIASEKSKSDATLNTDLGTRNKDSVVNDTPTPASTNLPKFHLKHNWVTNRLGATCMATLKDGGGLEIDTVFVGYKSGYIEAWNVRRIHSIDPKDSAQQRVRNHRRKIGKGISLEWKGYVHDTVRTLSFLPRCDEPRNGRPEMERSGKDKGSSSNLDDSLSAKKSEEHYLIVILSICARIGDKGKQHSTSSMLKILDLKKITNVMRNDAYLNQEGSSLENFSLPQSRGMELIESMTISSKDNRLPKRVPVLDSHGADAACTMGSFQLPGEKKQEACTGIAFPDGIICLFSSDKFDVVGIAHANHQVLLSYPSIGNGQVEMTDKNGKRSRYLAACLRGGTCYLIPTSTEDTGTESIATIPFPHDISVDSDLSDVYVQAFSAGNLTVDGSDIPILLYAWPGGVVDVYACELIDSKTRDRQGIEDVVDTSSVSVSRAERSCLQDLIDNDSLSLLSSIFDESRENLQNPLLQMDEWQQLSSQMDTKNKLPESLEDITIESLSSVDYQSLRRILLSLALVDE